MPSARCTGVLFVACLGCNTGSDASSAGAGGTATGGSPTNDGAETESGVDGGLTTGDNPSPDTSGSGPQPIFDVGVGETGETGGMACAAGSGIDSDPCVEIAPPDSFDAEIQWEFAGLDGFEQSMATPLVANLTDDNGDGVIDLCDIPEVIVAAFSTYGQFTGPIYALDGETGEVQWQSEVQVRADKGPALGDIDLDGLPEIVATAANGRLVAFEHDGSLKWTSNDSPQADHGALGIADFDNDGQPEIYSATQIFDSQGNLLVTVPAPFVEYGVSVAADLDGDGDLELVLGSRAAQHDGTLLYDLGPGFGGGYPQVADFDDDGDPEILVTTQAGLNMLEADGTIIYASQRPTGVEPDARNWVRPAAVHDFDGDGQAEYASASRDFYSVFEWGGTPNWSALVSDSTGIAAGTAFDFLGDGTAEAIYGDENFLYVFDEQGDVEFSVPRSSGTTVEYPVVADVDNDGSAEIVVVSNEGWMGKQTAPLVRVVRDVEDRWVRARRIWNQHAYHVTNVEEDGTIPPFELPHWQFLNTFRTNAQITAGGGVCEPEG